MAICPHCKSDSISAAAKILSGKGSPTQCVNCAGHSYSPPISLTASILGHALAAAALVVAFLQWHWWPIAAFAATLAGWVLWRVRHVPLIAVSPSQAAQYRRDGNIFLLLVVAGVVVIALLNRGNAV